MFDYLYKKTMKQTGGMTYGMSQELSEYLKYNKHDDINELYWMIQNGYSKNHIKNLIFKMTDKTTDELNEQYRTFNVTSMDNRISK
jgi:hypothetical protein